jgi:hypothetical protein
MTRANKTDMCDMMFIGVRYGIMLSERVALLRGTTGIEAILLEYTEPNFSIQRSEGDLRVRAACVACSNADRWNR